MAAPALVADDGTIPPQRVQVLYGLHAYTDKLSVEPGEEIQFHATSTVPYSLSVCRLGEEVDDPAGDQILKEFAQSPPRMQPIRPGSYIHVENGLDAEKPIEAITIECWLRPYLSDTSSGIVTQFDLPQVCGLGLFLNPNYRVSFYLGAGDRYEPAQLHHTAENTLQRNQWHHVVARWDGQEKTVWVDGKQIAAWPFTGSVRAGDSPLRLGARGDWGEAFRLLDADMAMPVIYDAALSDEAIQSRYADKALTQPQGDQLLACWPLYEERGSAVADISGNGRHGKIVNRGTWMIGGPSFDTASVPRWGITIRVRTRLEVTAYDWPRTICLTVVGSRPTSCRFPRRPVPDFMWVVIDTSLTVATACTTPCFLSARRPTKKTNPRFACWPLPTPTGHTLTGHLQKFRPS